MSIAYRIRDYIETNGLKMNFIAEKSGIPVKKFYRLLNGSTPMKIDYYESICKNGLSLDPSYFFKEKFSKNEKLNGGTS